MKNEGLLKKILEQLELLKGEQIVALAEEGKFADIKRIQEKIDYSKVIDYFFSDKFVTIDTNEIPDEYLIELVVWFNGTGEIDEGDLFYNLDNLYSRLHSLSDVGANMATLPELFNQYTVEELFSGEKE